MSHYPYISGQISEDALGTVSGSAPQTITSSATINTKGAWVQLIASTARHSYLLGIAHKNVDANQSYLWDIGIGAAASEKVIIPNLLLNSNAASTFTTGYTILPYDIPSGTRISARCQSNGVSKGMNASLHLLSGGFVSEVSETQPVVDYGATTASTIGTNVDSGAVVNTKGVYSQLTASTSQAHRGFFLCIAGNTNTATTQSFLLDVAVGASASEKIVLPNFHFRTITSISGTYSSLTPYFPIQIPSGTRLAVRAQCSSATSTNRQFDAVIYGVN